MCAIQGIQPSNDHRSTTPLFNYFLKDNTIHQQKTTDSIVNSFQYLVTVFRRSVVHCKIKHAHKITGYTVYICLEIVDPRNRLLTDALCAILVTISMAKESTEDCQDWPPFRNPSCHINGIRILQ